MHDCVNCGRTLDPGWKFCIYCGTRAQALSRPSIPAAIRPAPPADFPPDEEPAPAPRRFRVDVPLIIGIALGVAGIILIVYMLTVLSSE